MENKKELNKKIIKNIGNKFRLKNGNILHRIGEDYFHITPKGEIKLLLEFDFYKQLRKINIKKFMLVDEGIEKDQWTNDNYKKIGKYYELK